MRPRSMKGLRFYPACKLTNYPATISWMLVKDTKTPVSEMKGSILHIAVTVARIPAILHQFPKQHKEDQMSPAQWVVLQERSPKL